MPVIVSEQWIESWTIHLRAERKSPQTIKSYLQGLRGFLEWCDESGHAAELTRSNVNAYIAALLEGGKQPATARARQLSLRRFSAWLVEEGELVDGDPLAGLKPPKLDSKVIHPLSPEQIAALLKACRGKEFRDRRDDAIVRFMIDTGARAGEVASLQLADVDLIKRIAIIERGKGGKGRRVPFTPETAQAIDRYKRMRAAHRFANRTDLWLGERQRGFTYDALHKTLQGRAKAAGIEGFHPHLLRHTAAHRWLAAGGSEMGLMAVAGWERADMLQRYTRANAADRAIEEFNTLNLGEV